MERQDGYLTGSSLFFMITLKKKSLPNDPNELMVRISADITQSVVDVIASLFNKHEEIKMIDWQTDKPTDQRSLVQSPCKGLNTAKFHWSEHPGVATPSRIQFTHTRISVSSSVLSKRISFSFIILDVSRELCPGSLDPSCIFDELDKLGPYLIYKCCWKKKKSL